MIMLAGGLLALEALGESSIDGGVFSDARVNSDYKILGGKAAEDIPGEDFPSTDRDQHAPSGKPFFVLSQDNRCYWDNFKIENKRKKLVVFK